MAGADALIACWDTKFTYNFWRPVTAIPAADLDGNPHTDVDAAWSAFVVAPPFPEAASRGYKPVVSARLLRGG